MSLERWEKLLKGEGCPFCTPRPEENKFWSKVCSFSVLSLYLHKSQTYRGYALLIFDPRHATKPSDLTVEEWESFCSVLHVAQSAIEKVVLPAHMNVAALGNQICHLHWHIIPRYQDDPRWGAPIWTTHESEMQVVSLPQGAHQELVRDIRAKCI